ncbi:MAG: hypothetical protein WAL87_01850 [Chthoniobacterales bacterium]
MKSLFSKLLAASLMLALALVSPSAFACTAGCTSSQEVGTSYLFPAGPGGIAWTQYTFLSQSQNWQGMKKVGEGAGGNHDRLMQTSMLTGGFQYYWNSSWGASVTIPSAQRQYQYDAHNEVTLPNGETKHVNTPTTTQWWGFGDMQVNALYTGFSKSESMNSGLNLGLKLPTGYWQQPGVGRPNQIGTGSMDILFGFFHYHRFTKNSNWTWFTQAQLDAPVVTQAGYIPGLAVNTAAGIYYTGLSLGGVKIRPLGQALFVNKASDYGPEANTANSGYQQLSLSPGIEFDFKKIRIYADAELPVMNNVVGAQLIAPCTVKVVASLLF